MSWFFGKKKQHRESPPETPQEHTPSDDNFIFVEQNNQPSSNPGNLYPSLNNDVSNFHISNPVAPYPMMPNQLVVKQSSQDGHTSYMGGVPFKFCRELERSMNEDLVIDKLRLNEIHSFIERINVQHYNYSFNTERSVISEMNSQNEE